MTSSESGFERSDESWRSNDYEIRDLAGLIEGIDRQRVPRLASEGGEQAVDEARTAFANNLGPLAEEIIRKLGLEAADTIPLRLHEHPSYLAVPGSVDALAFANGIVESRAALLAMHPDEVAVVLTQALAERDAIPMLSLDAAPAVLRPRVAKLMAVFPAQDVTAMRAVLRAEINPRGAQRRGVFLAAARRFVERAMSAASDIDQYHPRVRDGHSKAGDFIRPIIDRIRAAIAGATSSADREAS